MIIYDQHFSISNNIVFVSEIDCVCFERIFDMMDLLITKIFVEVLDIE